MAVLSYQLNDFGHMLLQHCDRMELSISALSSLAGIKGSSRIYYAIRKDGPDVRRAALREDELLSIARALKLTREDEERLVVLAELEVAPPCLQRYVRGMEKRLSAKS